jgi:DDE superfamily endonuclease
MANLIGDDDSNGNNDDNYDEEEELMMTTMEDDDNMMYHHIILLSLSHLHLIAIDIVRSQLSSPSQRNISFFDQRLLWDDFETRFGQSSNFNRDLRMKFSSFKKILTWIEESLEVDNDMASLRGGAIPPFICLFVTIRYIAGGSYLDIRDRCGISSSSFYDCIWRTVHALRNCEELRINFPTTNEEVMKAAEGLQSVSSNGAITNCVAVVDGYHLQIETPRKADALNVRSYFSGHYKTYGFNVQAACDHQCRFVFIGAAGPGVMGDRDAINRVPLGRLIESLPGLYCVIGDCAYTATEHLVPIFRGENAMTTINDNFNFYASQLRIRIEMAFGLMVKKWTILQRPISIKMQHVWELVVAIGQLHNFCINERLIEGNNSAFDPVDAQLDAQQIALRESYANFDFEANMEITWSRNRDRMAQDIDAFHLTRPM